MICQTYFPFFPKEVSGDGIIITAVSVVDANPTWLDYGVKSQTRLVYDTEDRIEVEVQHAGAVNTFEFTRDSVKRLNYRGALLDLCWVDFVELAEGEVQSDFCPEGVKVVGTPWILSHPINATEVGREPDCVFEDKTHEHVKEQWQPEFVNRFLKQNENGARYRYKVRVIALFEKQKEEYVKKCFGLFQAELPKISFWSDGFSAVTWGSIKFRRHTLNWSGDIDDKNGGVTLTVTSPDFEIRIGGEFEYEVIGGDANRRDVGLLVGGLGSTVVADFVRAMAAVEAASYKNRRLECRQSYPTPRTNKRGIFSKR